ncbi:MAG: hypothetical protein WDO13_14425 [Verrucomicrobiota bacterium]
MDAPSPVEQLIPKGRTSGAVERLIPLSERAAFTPGEFAALFGHEQTWAYRQIYAGKIRVITGHGRMMIPKGEVERLQSEAAPLKT